MQANQEITAIQDREVLNFPDFVMFGVDELNAHAKSFTRFGGMVIAIFADGHSVCTMLDDDD